MTAITYVAKRGFEESGFSANGTDISASSADDSFNATATDLSGVVDDEWILVSGFSINDVNNGWFQADGASTTTKILEVNDPVVNLITEAAGDAVTITGYKRGLNESYEIETEAHILTPQDTPIAKQAMALDGTPETLFTRNDATWEVNTDFILESAWLQWREFIRSVSGGEIFTFDAYGSIASPDNPISVMLVGTPRYSNPYGKVMQLSMRVREL